MNKLFTRFASVLFISIFILFGCGGGSDEEIQIDPGFSQYINGFTSGIISKKTTFRISLASESKKFTDSGAEVADEPFDFSPSVEGVAVWVNANTIDFIPSELLKSGTKYEVEFDLGSVLDVESKFEEFAYQVQTINQNFEVKVDAMNVYNNKDLVWNNVSGHILFADVESNEKAEEILSAKQNDKSLKLSWIHGVDGKSHRFTIDSVERKKEEQVVDIIWNGEVIDVENVEGELAYVIPSLLDFKVMGVEVFRSPEQYILINFSDPLLPNQSLDGLIHFEKHDNLRFDLEGNKVKAYPSKRLTGTKKLVFEPGIKNILGYKLKEAINYEVVFEDYMPEVKATGKGVILPSSDGLVFPFKAVNLSAVDVKIIKIFENNIGQFLQVNRLDEDYQIRRVGRPVFSKKVNLVSETAIDKGVWNNYTLQLDELIEADPGAIYRVEISFKKAYSLYPCEGEDEDDNDEETNWDDANGEDELSYWDYSEDYYGEYYDWRERNDPCKKAYYNESRRISQNILASNIGVIAKSGNNKKIFVAVTDIRTTEPIKNADVEIYNYQNQIIKSGKTDGKGMVEIDLESKPFLLVVKKEKERGYLKLDDGSALSTSTFNVYGNKVQKGVKGFIYGERGVWRPGDTLFLNFILEDKDNLLPKNHPVKLELINPLGQIAKRIIKTKGVQGFYNFTIPTKSEDPTGNWLVKVNVGGAMFDKYIRIETIKPNRLKIKLDFGVDILSSESSTITGEMEVKWLHGAKAKNLKTKVGVTLTQANTNFKQYPDYTFMDPSKKFEVQEQELFTGTLNSEGIATITGDIIVKSAAPGFLNVNFTSRVFEVGGDNSIDRFSIPYSPYKKYIGIKLPKGDKRGMLLTDTAQTVQIVSVDYLGNPVNASNLKVSIYKLNWRWWWESSNDDIGNYVSNRSSSLITEFKAETSNGKGTFDFRIDYPEWGRYLVMVKDLSSGHSTGEIVYVDWPGWAGRGERNNPGGASMLAFSSDKLKYKVGEKAMISIPTSGKGRALLSIESGSKVIKSEWVEVNANEVIHSIEITPEMAPNVYVNVTLLQPHKHENSLPIRMYGVIPLIVENPATHLEPVINMPDELAPLTKVKIKVSEKEGKKMTYTLAIVDEGLLDLTRFATPNPHPVFYAREALGVKTWDLFDDVIGAYGGKLEGLLSIGGDEGINGKAKDKVNRFKPMVKFLGPFELGKGDENEHEVMIPNYIGSVRTMVIAGQDNAYGNADKTTPVKKPLMVLASLPRVLGPLETVKLPVTVFAMDKKVKTVKVKVTTNDIFSNQTTQVQTINFDEPGDAIVDFELKLAATIGKGKVKVEVESGTEKAFCDVELLVRHANPVQSKVVGKLIEGGTKDSIGYQLIGMKGTNETFLEISSIPAINLKNHMKYLLGYPHGCVEQTTSRAFPQLFLGDVMELTDKEKQKNNENVTAALVRLRSFQNGDGGFSYWPGANSVSDWGTSYVGHFIIEAELKGFTIPLGMKSAWINYQKRTARLYNPSIKNTSTSTYAYHKSQYDFAQVYRLFTLALSGNAEVGAMNRLKENNQLNAIGQHQLAASYYLIGEKEVAKKMISNITVNQVSKYQYGYSYGSKQRDEAMLLLCMNIMGQKNESFEMMKTVANNLGANGWLNTQAISFSLLSVAKYIGVAELSKEMNFVTTINGKTEQLTTKAVVKQFSLKSSLGTRNNVWVENKGKGKLFVRIITSGVPEPGNEKEESQNLTLSAKYLNLKGEEIDVTKLEQGTDFIVEVKVTNKDLTNFVDNVALTQIFPSGWEIFNQRMSEVEGEKSTTNSVFDYQDIRDDRVLTYFGLGDYNYNYSTSSKTFRITLNASFIGKYYLPAIHVGSMYDDKYSAVLPGTWVEVVAAGK